MKNSNWITANKCEVGKTYYLTGEYFDNRTGESCMNTPVKFKGRDRTIFFTSIMADTGGQYVFTTETGETVNAYAKTVFFLEKF